ncbi:putative transferase caf-17 [Phytophthora citrophthora]|uniref:Transferase caf-17 n=1 Tax=Phytophthora citrophthora TaxID=4793 RepID=A0AAD9GVK4_9STRA|nr:putative transferase caf-17 [Phytophthora citrophthora]
MASLLRRSGVARLTNRRLTQLQGADAARFIQAVLTNDMKNVTRRGDALYGGFLSTKGRVVGDCNVLQLADDAFLLDYDEEVAEPLMKHWKRYKLRMKVKIEDKTDTFALYATLPAVVDEEDAALSPSVQPLDELQALNTGDNTVVYADPRGDHFGVRAIVPADATFDVPEGYEEMDTLAYMDHRIALGVAEGHCLSDCMITMVYSKELVDGIPLECNLDLMQGVSFRKGCYVGQELTARTQFKGNIRKRLVPVALIPSEQQDVVKVLSELAFKPFNDSSHGSLRAYLAGSKGWKDVKAPEIGDKLVATGQTKAVGTIFNVGKNVSSALAMMRLGHLFPSESEAGETVPTMKFSTQDGAFHAVPYQPSWWPTLDLKTGKMSTFVTFNLERRMTDEELQRDQAQLRAAIEGISNAALKTHMLAALNAFDASTDSAQSDSTTNVVQNESDKSDAVAAKLREKSVTVQEPRDALFLAIHALLLEAGYKVATGTSSEFVLPDNWDANSSNGLFNATYVHPNDDSIKFSLQGLFVGGKFEVYISDDKDHTHSIELSVDTFVFSAKSTGSVQAAGLLQNLKSLREKFTPFAESIRPAKKKITLVANSPGFVPPPDRDDQGYGAPSPARIPPVGGGDAFPPAIGGGDPSTLVGPDHPLFGHRGDPSIGPVPGARFDPFGPSIDPLGPSGGFRPPSRGPAPRMPFGGPGPDHLRMPRDDDMDPFGGYGGGRGGGGFSQPFGSNHSFF